MLLREEIGLQTTNSQLTFVINLGSEIFTRNSCTGRYCWERILAVGILSVCLSVWRVTTCVRNQTDSVARPMSISSDFLFLLLLMLGGCV